MFKKYIIIILFLVIVLGISIFIIINNNNNNNKQIILDDPNLEMLKEKHEIIDKIVAYKFTEGGRICYDVTEYKDNIYNSLVNMKIIKETDERATDTGLMYLIKYNDNTETKFSFELGNYILKNKHYKLEKTSYKIYYEKEIECE